MWMRVFLFVAGLLGLSGLILDAVGAHALSNWVEAPQLEQALRSWATATRVQLIHAVAFLGLAILLDRHGRFLFKLTGAIWLIGTGLFCTSIYLKILMSQQAFGSLAPYGGVCLMAGWLCLALSALRP